MPPHSTQIASDSQQTRYGRVASDTRDDVELRLVGDTFGFWQTAKLIGIDGRTLRRMVERSVFPAPFKQNLTSSRTGRLLFNRAQVLEWIEVNRRG
jgi:transposase-like protein